MALSITHLKVSGLPDNATPAQVQPSDWNTAHVVSGTLPAINLDLTGVVPITRSVNGHALSGDVTITLADLGLSAPVSPAQGGTGIAAGYAVGDLLYASAAGVLSKLADIAVGNVLLSGGVAAAPSYGKVDLTLHVTGILPAANVDLSSRVPTTRTINGYALSGNIALALADLGGSITVAQGGTGLASYAIGDLLYASASGVLSKLADVAIGSMLVSGGVGAAPAWSSSPTANIITGTTALQTDTYVTWGSPTARVKSVAPAGGVLTLRNQNETIGIRFQFNATPTVASGFGTSPAITTGSTDTAGEIDVGTGGVATSGVINFNATWASAPQVLVQNKTSNIACRVTVTSTTQFTITSAAAFGANDKIAWLAIGAK